MSQDPTPWESAAAKLKYFETACEAHAKTIFDLSAAAAKLQSERDELHRTLLNREASLKQQSDEWVKAMTERDALRAQVKRLREALQRVYDETTDTLAMALAREALADTQQEAGK